MAPAAMLPYVRGRMGPVHAARLRQVGGFESDVTLLFLIFVVLPLAEIATFVQAGEIIGVWPTLGLTVLTALVGAAAMRTQGFGALRRVQEAAELGDDPGPALMDGAMILVGGALLLAPGFLTDFVGFLLLLPPVRALLITRAGGRLARAATRRGGFGPGRGQAPRRPPVTVEGDFEEASADERPVRRD